MTGACLWCGKDAKVLDKGVCGECWARTVFDKATGLAPLSASYHKFGSIWTPPGYVKDAGAAPWMTESLPTAPIQFIPPPAPSNFFAHLASAMKTCGCSSCQPAGTKSDIEVQHDMVQARLLREAAEMKLRCPNCENGVRVPAAHGPHYELCPHLFEDAEKATIA